MHFKGAIFDLDGTLENSQEDIIDSLNQVLAENDFPMPSLVDVRSFIGKGMYHLVRVALPEDGRDQEILASCYHRMVEVYKKFLLIKSGRRRSRVFK